MKNLRVTCAAVLACASFAAMAQSGDAAASTHWRFGLQLGTVQDHDNTEPAAQVSMGYDFNRNVSVEALADMLKRAAGDSKDPIVVINADAQATHQSVVHVMEAARAAGFVHITFATQASPNAPRK